METIKGPLTELASKAADLIQHHIKDLLKSQSQVNLAIPGGRSVGTIFKELKEKDIPWEKVHIFMVDERRVPVSSVESNFKLAQDMFIQELFNKKKLLMQNIHPFISHEDDPEHAIRDYEHIIEDQGGKIDIILLSSGEDGHVGGLYPNNHTIKDDSDYFITFDDSPKPPPKRMSMTRKLMLTAKVAIILFIGDSKKEAYEKFKEGEDIIECPARLVKKIPKGYVLTDL